MTTALGICQAAYRQVNLDQTLSSFSNSQEFPYNIALDLINTVIQEMNRMGRYWFAETSLALTYTLGINTYNLGSIDPKDVTRIRREAENYQGELQELNYRAFQRKFENNIPPIQMPKRWSKFNNTLFFDSIPDQDYTITLYYFEDIPQVVNTTDTLIIPFKDEDVIREGVYAYLCERIGRPDFGEAYQNYLNKISKLLADMKKDTGLPQQWPGAF